MAIKKQLDRLEQITDLRDVWDSEAGDFTPWLAEDENLELLGMALFRAMVESPGSIR